MQSKRIRPRLEDVAERAGVSAATVSRFLNKPDVVSADAARRIQEAIGAVGYVPNLIAGGLASKRSRLVAILVPGLTQSPFTAVIESIIEALARDRYSAMLGITGHEESGVIAMIDAAIGRQVDGIILTGIVADRALRTRLQAAGPRIIETWGLPEDPVDVSVGFRHAEVGRAVARYFHRRGYARPLLITARGTRSIERRVGFIEEWESLGGGSFQEIDVESPSRFSQARSVFRAIRQLPNRPDVVMCGSDGLAQGLIVEAMAAGMSLPDDLAIMGFGNSPQAADMRPSITTVHVDGERIGHTAAGLMSAGPDAPLTERSIDVGFQLIERESA